MKKIRNEEINHRITFVYLDGKMKSEIGTRRIAGGYTDGIKDSAILSRKYVDGGNVLKTDSIVFGCERK